MFTGKELINMKKMEQLYEGKAKKVFKTDDENLYIVDYLSLIHIYKSTFFRSEQLENA